MGCPSLFFTVEMFRLGICFFISTSTMLVEKWYHSPSVFNSLTCADCLCVGSGSAVSFSPLLLPLPQGTASIGEYLQWSHSPQWSSLALLVGWKTWCSLKELAPPSPAWCCFCSDHWAACPSLQLRLGICANQGMEPDSGSALIGRCLVLIQVRRGLEGSGWGLANGGNQIWIVCPSCLSIHHSCGFFS